MTEGSAPLKPDLLPPAEVASPNESQEPSETDSSANSAADAAEAAATGPDSEEPIGAETAQAQANPFGSGLTPAALVQVCEVTLYVIVRAVCVSKRVPFTEDVAKLAKFTKLERADLEAQAPLAIPYLARQFEKAPEWAGAAMFGISFAAVASSRVSAATARAAHAVTRDE